MNGRQRKPRLTNKVLAGLQAAFRYVPWDQHNDAGDDFRILDASDVARAEEWVSQMIRYRAAKQKEGRA